MFSQYDNQLIGRSCAVIMAINGFDSHVLSAWQSTEWTVKNQLAWKSIDCSVISGHHEKELIVQSCFLPKVGHLI